MIGLPPRILTLAGVAGTGLVAGVLFAFSAFVMTALGRLPAAQGLSAMQAINRAAPSPLFMAALFGTSLVCVGVAVSALGHLGEASARWALAGSILYLGAVALTIAYHVPRNDALAAVTPTGAGAADAWTHYLAAWTAWNHVRTLASFSATVMFLVSLQV